MGWLRRLCEKAFTKALWVYHVNTGSCNGCDIEVLDALTPYYDPERFGIRLVGSPRHADVLVVTGPVTRQSLPALLRAYEAAPEPKLVIAVGDCACGGDMWFDSYNIVGPPHKHIKVDYFVPGCPPRPEAILYGVAVALGLAEEKVEPQHLSQEFLAKLGLAGKGKVGGGRS